MPKKKIGLIAGNGKFPFLLAREARFQGYHVVAAAIRGDTFFLLRFFVDKLEWFHAGELKGLFTFFVDEGVGEVIMAGQVNPDNLFEKSVAFDKEFQGLFNALRDRKADTIFGAIADKLKAHGICLLDSTFLLKKYLAPRGTLTKRAPSSRELDDVEFGKIIARDMGRQDIGQTVVIKEKAIIAIEAMEGTDRAILRGGKIAREGAVIVKMSKPAQDPRFDVPVIGPRTIRTMIRAKASCIGVDAGKTIIIDQEYCIKLANRSGICIIAA